jgi:ankyrin repeat protein
MSAVWHGNVEVVELLLNKGANIEGTDEVINTYVQVSQLFMYPSHTTHMYAYIYIYIHPLFL